MADELCDEMGKGSLSQIPEAEDSSNLFARVLDI
jgi:hypothetical protein